ncbi:MAG TPA: hypothetical protein VEP90_23455, partial [Methylomirabilota bacterium]|nr:hypothetical protein [Methylomirabilota bacterium]
MAATPRIYDYLFNSAYTLIANPRQSLLEIPLLFTDTCRQKLLSNVSSAEVHKFWSDYKQFSQQKQDEEARELLRRLNDLSDDPLRFIVGQSQSTIHLQKIMDEGKILLVKLDRRLEQATSLIGSMIVALILNASATRTTYKHFHLYADEFQRFATEDFATLLEEARKAGIGITMAHQNRAQLELSNKQADSQLKARTLNVGSLVVFRVPTDAVALAGQFDTTPPPAELRREETLTPVSNPFDWLVSHTHTNPVVNRFVDNHLRIIHHTLSSGWGYQKDILLEFNSFLYRAMTSSDPLSMLCEKSSLSFLLKLNDSYPIGTYYFGETVIAGLPELESHLIQSTVRFSSSIPNQLRHSDKPEYVPVSMPILAARRRSEGGKIDYSVLDETMLSRFAAMIRAIGDNEFHHASDQFARPAQLKLKKLIETYITAYQIAFEKHGGIIPTRKFSLYGYLEPEEEAKRCEQEFPRWMTEERAQFETFIKEFRDFILALAKKPITAGSGIYEMKPVGQMTS